MASRFIAIRKTMASHDNSVVILISVFNDWSALELLIPRIQRAVGELPWSVSLLIFLYSPFDASIGHFRRYSKKSLTAAASLTDLRLVRIAYLDAAGLCASAAN
jgi:hypothetical protein